jgi:hypothetical protein
MSDSNPEMETIKAERDNWRKSPNRSLPRETQLAPTMPNWPPG